VARVTLYDADVRQFFTIRLTDVKHVSRPKTSNRGRSFFRIIVVLRLAANDLQLDRLKQGRHRGTASNSADADEAKLSLSILQSSGWENVRTAWRDDEQGKLEARITEIAVEIILTAELQYREGKIRNYEWRVQRKAEGEEEEREKKRQAERAERERQKRLEQARIDRLLKSAAAFQQAGEVRKYVEAIRATQAGNPDCSSEELERWSQWALAEAARIDPVVGGKFLLAMREE
jgi:hypothetical protein